MEKNILIWLLLLLSPYVNAQCNIIGTATSVPSGSFICNPASLNPAITNINETPITRCFNYQYLGPVRLSYLLVTGQCGPFPLYNQLAFSLYNATCDTLIQTGTIIPTQTNTFINYLNPGSWYVICYTWIPNCPQTAACPLIYTSLLPVELLEFKVTSTIDDVKIRWVTASQTQVDRFIVMRSYDNENWTELVSYEGEGYTTNVEDYEYHYAELRKGIVYYKLLELTYDGNLNEVAVTALNKSGSIVQEGYYDILGRKTEIGSKGIYIVGNRIIYK